MEHFFCNGLVTANPQNPRYHIVMSTARTFSLTLILIVATLFALLLPGCGGSNTNNNSLRLNRTPLNATVTLPAASPTSPQSLTVWTSGGTSTPNSQNQARVTIFNNGPQYTDARDSQGRLVLAAYLGQGETTLNHESTAETLIFVALGGLAQIDNGPATILSGVRDLPGFSGVATEVQNQLENNGYISFTSGTLRTQIQAIVDSIKGSRSHGRGTIAEPTSGSGLFLDTLVDGQFTIQNNHLRRSHAWLQRVSFVDKDGNTVESLGQAQEFDIAPPSRYGGLTSTIAGIVTGDMTWTPTVSNPLQIPLFPTDAESTTYKLTTVGLGAGSGDEASIGNERAAKMGEVMLKSLFLDVFIPAIANIILPLNGDQIDSFIKFSSSNVILTDLINSATTALPELVGLLQEGKLEESILLVYNSAFTSNTALPLIIDLMTAFAEQFGDNAILAGVTGKSEEIAERLSLLGYVDVFFSAADMVLLARDVANSDRANCFFLTTTGGGKITITPDKSLVCQREPVQLSVTIQNKLPGTAYEYVWTVPTGYEVESSTNGASVNGTLKTSQDTVTLTATRVGIAEPSCTVSRIDGTKRIPVDTRSVKVTFVENPTFSPEDATIAPDKTVTFTGSWSGTGTPNWRYTVINTGVGTLSNTGTASTNSSTTFTPAASQGTANIRAEMLLADANNRLQTVCSTILQVNIGSVSSYPVNFGQVVESYPEPTFPDGVGWAGYVSAYIVITPIPGAQSYEIYEGSKLINVIFPGDLFPWTFKVQQAFNPNQTPIWYQVNGWFTAGDEKESETLAWIANTGMPRMVSEAQGKTYNVVAIFR